MIPRKLALRIWSACLLQQADHLVELATGAQHQSGRGEVRGRLPGAAKAPGRLAKADRLEDQGRTVRGWVNMDHRTRGADLDPSLVAIVAAYLFAHGQAVRDLKSWLVDRGHPGWIDGVDTADAPALIARILELH